MIRASIAQLLPEFQSAVSRVRLLQNDTLACIAHFVQIESNVIVHINMLSPEPLQFFCHFCITYEIKPCTWGKNVPADRKDGIVSTTNLDKRCAGIKDKEKNR